MTILRKRIIFQHKDYPRGKTLPNLYAKRQFRVLVSLIYQNTRGDGSTFIPQKITGILTVFIDREIK